VLCGAVQEDEALEALRVIAAALNTAQLKHLNLSDNALGEKGLRAAAASFQHPVSNNCSLQTAKHVSFVKCTWWSWLHVS
jgi:Ran GTPase-activating protein (RanGAP) involved in mRNA processing and transport